MPKNQDMSDEDMGLLVDFFDSPEGDEYMKELLKKDVPSKKHSGKIKIKQEIRYDVKTNP